MKKTIIPVFMSLFSIFAFYGCKHDTTPPVIDDNTLTDTVYFNDEVLPLIQSNCSYSSCHGGNQNPDLNSYSNIMKLVKAGNPQESRLYQYAIGNQMPPAPKTLLNLKQVTSIYAWIKQGALDNTEPCDTSVYTYSGAVSPIIQSNCLGCHNTGSANGELVNYSQISTKANDIFARITSQGSNKMPPPPSNPLSECKITKITKWISNGKQND